jgi:hypothetical protein
MDKRCLICKYSGKPHDEHSPIMRGVFYDKAGKPISVNLCRSHERELFVAGQFGFLEKYHDIGKDFMEVDKDFGVLITLLNLLKQHQQEQKNLQFRRSG